MGGDDDVDVDEHVGHRFVDGLDHFVLYVVVYGGFRARGV